MASTNESRAGAGANDGIELAMQQRTKNVVQGLIRVTKDCSSVAVSLPPPLNIHVIDLFLGFCIQEVAALSALLGRQFEEQKAEVLQTTIGAARVVKGLCRERTTKSQQQHASRLVQYALHL